MKKALAALIIAPVALVASEVPEVLTATMSQPGPDRLVTINYTFQNGPAVITLDVQTNANNGAWASIGGEAIWNATGDVWKKVEGTSGTITWRPDLSWPGHKIEDGNARAVVTAWSLGNTPDYMVVDLDVANTVNYYPSAEFLPKSSYSQDGAAVTNNPAYKTNKLLMRKIMAKGITWTMGSNKSAEKSTQESVEAPHPVELPNNYYIGVFEVTQAQWLRVAKSSTRSATFTLEGSMRPMETVSFNEIRHAAGTTANVSAYYPAAPHEKSFLGYLQAKSGLDFDLPSEAQWEFAARAGHGSGFWNDGSVHMNKDTDDTNLAKLGRYKGSGLNTTTRDDTIAPDEGGTAIVGSYLPSSWGLYDMHGNVWEFCLDWYEADITKYGGAVNVDTESPEKTLSGTKGSKRVMKGASLEGISAYCTPGRRTSKAQGETQFSAGFRVVCRAGLD